MDFLGVNDVSPLIYNGVFDMHAVLNGGVGQEDGVSDNGALLYYNATADDGIFNRSLDQTTVTDKGIGNLGTLEILCRAGVGGPGIDGPFCSEQVAGNTIVQKFKRCIEVVVKTCQCSEVASVLIASYIKILALDIDDICQGIDR